MASTEELEVVVGLLTIYEKIVELQAENKAIKESNEGLQVTSSSKTVLGELSDYTKRCEDALLEDLKIREENEQLKLNMEMLTSNAAKCIACVKHSGKEDEPEPVAADLGWLAFATKSKQEIEFEHNIKKLKQLLDDPQEGLTTYHQARIGLAKEIFQFLWDEDFRPKED